MHCPVHQWPEVYDWKMWIVRYDIFPLLYGIDYIAYFTVYILYQRHSRFYTSKYIAGFSLTRTLWLRNVNYEIWRFSVTILYILYSVFYSYIIYYRHFEFDALRCIARYWEVFEVIFYIILFYISGLWNSNVFFKKNLSHWRQGRLTGLSLTPGI